MDNTTTNIDLEVFFAIHKELPKARELFPDTEDTMHALTEEVGELAKALIQQKHEPHKGVGCQDIFQEAIQVAVMAIRVAAEGDRNFPLYHPQKGLPQDDDDVSRTPGA